MKRFLFSCLLIILISAPFLSAQNLEWTYTYPSLSLEGPVIFLDNGNLLHSVSRVGSTRLYELTTNGILEDSTGIVGMGADERPILLHQAGPDTVLVVSRNGMVLTLTDGLQSSSPAAPLFPRLTAVSANISVNNAQVINGEIIVDAINIQETDSSYVAHATYKNGLIASNIIARDYFVMDSDYSPSGSVAELIDSAFNYRIRVTDPAGEVMIDTLLMRDGLDIDNIFFAPDGVVYLTGLVETSPFYGIMLKLNPNTGVVTSRIFNAPDDPGGVLFSNHRFVGDQLILSGTTGISLMTKAYAISIDQWDNVRWRFQSSIRLGMNWITEIVEDPDNVEEIYLSGRAGVTPHDYRTFLLKLSALPTSTSMPATTPILLFPNPTDSHLSIEGLPAGVREVEVIDLTGRVLSRSVSGQVINVQKLPAGTYFVRAETAGEWFLGKFVRR